MKIFKQSYIGFLDSRIYLLGMGSIIRIIPGVEIWYSGEWNYGIEFSWLFFRLKIVHKSELPF